METSTKLFYCSCTLLNLVDYETCREKKTLAGSHLETFTGSHLETNFIVLKISRLNFFN